VSHPLYSHPLVLTPFEELPSALEGWANVQGLIGLDVFFLTKNWVLVLFEYLEYLIRTIAGTRASPSFSERGRAKKEVADGRTHALWTMLV